MDNDRSMHLVLLDFADKQRAGEHVEGHNAWIEKGFADDAFMLTGTIPGRGGVVIVHNASADDVADRVGQDPFVEHGVVTATIHEVVPSRVHTHLERLLHA